MGGIEGMEKTMKKLIALLFLGLISISALGCSSETTEPTDTEPATTTEPVAE